MKKKIIYWILMMLLLLLTFYFYEYLGGTLSILIGYFIGVIVANLYPFPKKAWVSLINVLSKSIKNINN